MLTPTPTTPRTQAQIYNDMTSDKQSDSNLNTLLPNPDNWVSLFTVNNFKLLANTIVKGLSTSQVAIWRLIYFVASCAIMTIEQLVSVFENDVLTITTNNQYGSIQWILQQISAFQYGYSLSWIQNNSAGYYGYTTIDITANIITQSSANVANGQLIINAATGAAGSQVALITDQLTALQKYLVGTQSAGFEDGILPAGTSIIIQSKQADDFKTQVNIYYDPTLLTSTGLLISDGITYPVNVAITNYIQRLPNGRFRLIDYINAIQAAVGVKNVIVLHADSRWGSNPYTDIMSATDTNNKINQSYLAFSGYMWFPTGYDLNGNYDGSGGSFPTITYIPYTQN